MGLPTPNFYFDHCTIWRFFSNYSKLINTKAIILRIFSIPTLPHSKEKCTSMRNMQPFEPFIPRLYFRKTEPNINTEKKRKRIIIQSIEG